MTGRFNCTLVMSLVFSSCVTRPDIDAQVTVMKVENDQLVVVANSYDEGLAWKGANARAEEQCFRNGKKDYVVVKDEVSYHGQDKTAKAVAEVVGSLIHKETSGKDISDHRIKLTIRCDGAYTGKGEPFPKTK